ncbi:uncharacterized protein G2W53_044011 [Senna tora]|uniref:Uncharacterized protein n=1 Tax=Senna tora TaxID=362788 RepID=A0A834SM52_9FABA|nr:uncharacterized protein G2W53_044011 [Senna tora]
MEESERENIEAALAMWSRGVCGRRSLTAAVIVVVVLLIMIKIIVKIKMRRVNTRNVREVEAHGGWTGENWSVIERKLALAVIELRG